MSDDLWARLRTPFPPEDIDQLPRKNRKTNTTIMLDYVGHAAVTDRLLQVDPTWNWRPLAISDEGGPRIVRRGDALELWISLTVGGVSRLGVGTVPVDYADDGRELPSDQDTAKELIGDAIRNAAMRFGVALDLWRKHTTNVTPVASGPPCPHCGTPVAFNEEKNRGKKPVWACPNFGCGGGSAKKEGEGNWPWGSYDPNYFKEDPDDPVDILKQVGLIGVRPVVPETSKLAWEGDMASLTALGIDENQARSELEAMALNPRFSAGSIKEMRAHVNRAITITIAMRMADGGVLNELWDEWRGDDPQRKLVFWTTARAHEVYDFAKHVQGWLRGILGV